MAFDPTTTPYGGGQYQPPPNYSAGSNFGAGENGIPDPQQQAPGTPTSAQKAPGDPDIPRTKTSTDYSDGGSVPGKMNYADGGDVEPPVRDDSVPSPPMGMSGLPSHRSMDEEGIPDPNAGPPMEEDHSGPIISALDTVKEALAYGRKLHGITGGDQAAAMPTRPGTQSESGIPPDRPQPPGPVAAAMPMRPGTQSESGLPPTPPEQGKVAAAMPMRPGSQSESGIPPDRPQPPQVAENDEEEDNGTG